MMNIDLIELQKGCEAICVVIPNEDIEKIDSKIVINSNCEDSKLLRIFKEQILEEDEKFHYFVIEEIDKLEIEKQAKFYQIVKDREFYGYLLPKDTIIVLTVKDKDGLKNISQELYHLCVVAF